MDYSLPGSSLHGISQARVLEWVAISFILLTAIQSLSRVKLFVISWITACQAPLSMGFPRQEYWSGLPFPPPGELPDPGIEPAVPVSPALTGGFFTP